MSLLFGDDFIGKTDLTGKNYAFQSLFVNNTKIISAKNLILPATTLTESCYRSMFTGCTFLTTGPALPTTTLAGSCYRNMFSQCTNLTTGPALPATTLTNACYSSMFSSCINLKTAPELPATTLASSCYFQMFYYCSKLNYVKCLATDISASGCTNSWLSGVNTTGTFVTADNVPAWKSGGAGIPSGWTTYTETQYSYARKYEISPGPQGPQGPQGTSIEMLQLTQTQYDNIQTPSNNILYVIVGS
jgi:hypothetical protein